MGALWSNLVDAPTTFVTIIGCSSLWLYLWHANIGYRSVGYNFPLVFEGKQYWRLATATYSHVALLHCVFNMFTLLSLRTLESPDVGIGRVEYLKATFVLAVFSSALLAALDLLLVQFSAFAERVRTTFSLGYSCVLFGLATISSFHFNNEYSVFGLAVPPFAMILLQVLLISLLVPNASLAGHLAGVMGGLVWAGGGFAWLGDYLFWCALGWSWLGFLWSVKTTSQFPLPLLAIDGPPPPLIVQGVIQRPPRAPDDDAV